VIHFLAGAETFRASDGLENRELLGQEYIIYNTVFSVSVLLGGAFVVVDLVFSHKQAQLVLRIRHLY